MRVTFRTVLSGVVIIATSINAFAADDEPASKVSIDEVVVALNQRDLSASELRSIASFQRLDIINLAKLEGHPDFGRVEIALAGTEDGWAIIQTAVVENGLITQELRSRSISIQGIAAATQTGAVITIYIR